MLDCALLLENHPSQIQQDLVPFYLQLGLFVQLSVSQPDAAELQIGRKYLESEKIEKWNENICCVTLPIPSANTFDRRNNPEEKSRNIQRLWKAIHTR